MESNSSQIQSLPRSIRWRIHLGLLQFDNNNGNLHQSKEGSSNPNSLIREIESRNEKLISDQRQRYENLSGKHYKNSSAIEIIHDSEQKSQNSTLNKPIQSKHELNIQPHARKTSSSIHSNKKLTSIPSKNISNSLATTTTTTTGSNNSKNNIIEDPLSVFAKIQEVKVKSEKQKEIEMKKERALAARSQYSIAHQYNDTKKNVVTKIQNPQLHHHTKHDDDKEVGQRWSEFYSSREMMDIIEKDVNRLPVDHQVATFFTKMNCSQHLLATNNDDDKDIIFNLESEVVAMNKSLEDDDARNEEIMKQCRHGRSIIISQVLFVYAKEYPVIGYRQGMHEILSLIYLCVEIDLLKCSYDQQQLRQPQQDQITQYILDETKIANDAYTIFEKIMSMLSPAFEVRDIHNKASSSSSPMEIIGNSIVGKIRSFARDEELYQLISSLSIPPEIYCTRWVRLMFSREVKGLSNVFQLWDAFFQLVASITSKIAITTDEIKGNDSLINYNLIHILESTAVTMIVMLRHELIQPIQQRHNMHYMGIHDEDDRDPSDCIHLLMNYPPIDDITKLIQINVEIMSGKFNRDYSSTSTQISMGNETNIHFKDEISNHIQNNQQFQSPIENNMNVGMTYGSNPLTGPYRPHDDVRYFNDPVRGQIHTQGQMNYNPYIQQTNNNNIKSAIGSIAGNETFKLISGGFSEGLNAFKGALGSLDQKINAISISGNMTSYSPLYSGSQYSHQQDTNSNVYDPAYRNTNNGQTGFTVDGQIFRNNENHNNIIQESPYHPSYRQHNQVGGNVVFIDPVQDRTHHVLNDTSRNVKIPMNTAHQNRFQQVALSDSPLNPTPQLESAVHNEYDSIEDHFVGGGGSAQISNHSESHQLAERLDSSLLQLSAYLQNQVVMSGNDSHSVPQSVWDAMAEIDAIKKELTTIYKVSRNDR